MKNLKIAFLSLLSFFVITTAFSQAVSRNNPNWELLGKRTVNYAVDHDEIVVTSREGNFSAIKLKIKVAPLNMHRCVVHFGNGESHEIQLRENFLAGSESRVIDLPGTNRIINRITFYYDTKNLAKNKALVEVWGKH